MESYSMWKYVKIWLKSGKHMFSNLSVNPYPIYNSIEDSKPGFSNSAEGNFH